MSSPAPAQARLGLLFPGLGHVLSGKFLEGLPMMAHTTVLFAAVILSASRLGRLLLPGASEGSGLHARIGAIVFAGTAFLLWREAWRFTKPQLTLDRDAETQVQMIWRQFTRHRMGVAGLHCVLFLGLVTLLTPYLTVFDPDAIDAGPKSIAPCWPHIFGTDEYGRDLWSRLLFGARISLSVGFLAVGISATFGALWGAVSGYVGGKIDMAMVWFVDFMLSLPRLVLVLTIVGLFRPKGAQGIYLIIGVLGFTGWMGVSRIVRGLVLSLKEQDFVQAARAIGQSPFLIVAKHLLPNAIAPVIVHATLGIGLTILLESTLSFIGLGVPPPISTWGSIVSDGREALRSSPWVSTIPGLLIVFAVMSFNLLGDGLRDALDPRSIRR